MASVDKNDALEQKRRTIRWMLETNPELKHATCEQWIPENQTISTEERKKCDDKLIGEIVAILNQVKSTDDAGAITKHMDSLVQVLSRIEPSIGFPDLAPEPKPTQEHKSRLRGLISKFSKFSSGVSSLFSLDGNLTASKKRIAETLVAARLASLQGKSVNANNNKNANNRNVNNKNANNKNANNNAIKNASNNAGEPNLKQVGKGWAGMGRLVISTTRTSKWVTTGHTVLVHRGNVLVEKMVYRNYATGELRVRKMVLDRTTGKVRARYVTF